MDKKQFSVSSVVKGFGGDIDTLVFFIICGFALAMMSGMLYFRLAGGGAPGKAIFSILAGLWVSYIVAAGVLVAVSYMLGPSGGAGAAGEIKDIVNRWGSLSRQAQMLVVGGLAAAVALFVEAIISIRRAFQKYPLE